jgi:hypothetical protein
MKKKLIILSAFIITTIAFMGCYYDKAELVYPPATSCDTTAVKYSTDIVGILSANCYACHSGTASASGGRKLDSHANLLTFVNSGELAKAITHTGGVTPMPYNQPKMQECSINKILGWINDGAPNN